MYKSIIKLKGRFGDRKFKDSKFKDSIKQKN